MTTTQEHIDGLIATIWHATEDRSVTNIMVARVLDWLNRRALQLQEEIGNGHTECRKELEKVRKEIADLTDMVKGVNTLAGSAYGRADTNARAIEKLGIHIKAILQYLQTGTFPGGWDGSGLDLFGVIDRDRGKWKEGENYYNGVPEDCDGVMERSHVWYLGCKFVCRKAFTKNPPAWNSKDWEFEEGNPDLTLSWAGNEDSVFMDNPEITLEVSASLYNQDLTDEPRIRWDWTRETWRDGVRDILNDEIWNNVHANIGTNAQTLGMEDMNYQFGRCPDRLTYYVTATLRDDAGTVKTQQMRIDI